MNKNKSSSLSWEDFQSLGNPNNPDITEDNGGSEISENYNHLMKVRVWLDKKNRRGKKATIIKGLELDDDQLNELCKEMKNKCGVGGAAKNGEIIIQGDQRKKVSELLIEKGYSQTKQAGG